LSGLAVQAAIDLVGAFLAIAAMRQRARDGDLTTLRLIPIILPGLLRQQLCDTISTLRPRPGAPPGLDPVATPP
jgi:hypothetical protein